VVTPHSFLGLPLDCAKNRWIAIVVIGPREAARVEEPGWQCERERTRKAGEPETG
jgi:hypothetical protein